ncbi:MAG TPA: DUF4124 domain-containing protein [Burkholderiales bacterium]|jgi:hypothetical protein|nr:DUF4124 domain-containing protein [Burkholderiales bacterium]
MRNAPYLAAAVALALAPASFAQGTVWRCTEADGHPHYTNIKKDTEGKTCQVVTKEVSVVPASHPGAAAQGTRSSVPQAATATPPNFPRVDRETQRARDDNRRKILQDELASEEKSLVDAKSKLTEQESVRHGDEKNYQRVLDRLKPYQEAVERHERNVSALRRELANLR